MLSLRFAEEADLPVIKTLLFGEGLPAEDLTPAHLADFLIGSEPYGGAQACIGVEVHGSNALLRSLVVKRNQRSRGLGRSAVEAIEQHAEKRGVIFVYLLTTTAPEFFEQLGYRRIDRQTAPEALQCTAEFSSLCPASAICLRKDLRDTFTKKTYV